MYTAPRTTMMKTADTDSVPFKHSMAVPVFPPLFSAEFAVKEREE